MSTMIHSLILPRNSIYKCKGRFRNLESVFYFNQLKEKVYLKFKNWNYLKSFQLFKIIKHLKLNEAPSKNEFHRYLHFSAIFTLLGNVNKWIKAVSIGMLLEKCLVLPFLSNIFNLLWNCLLALIQDFIMSVLTKLTHNY